MLTREELIGTGECRDRDEELVRLVGRHGLMTIEQAQRAMGAGRSVTYRRVRRLADAGLVERVTVPGAGPLLHATRREIRWSGLPLPVAAICRSRGRSRPALRRPRRSGRVSTTDTRTF